MNTRLHLPRGLRARLVAAFLLAAAFGALLTAGLTFQQARSAILERTQNSAVDDLRTQLGSLTPDLTTPPSSKDLRDLTLQLDRAGGARAWRSTASYQGADPVSVSPDAPPVPRGLRETVQDEGQAAYERTERDGRPWLTVGTPVAYTHDPPPPKGTSRLSGLTVYASFPLDDDQADIDALVTAARTGAIPSLVLAVVPALFAARSVLRPVRRLRSGAERVAAGRFDTRLDAEGHDELADLTRSFNTMAATLQKDDAELRRMEAGARRFAADVAHELRTPLAAMVAVTEVLDEDAASGALPTDTADAVRLISGETRKIARLVEDLMEVSRFDAKAAPLDAEDLDLRTIVSKTLRLRGWADDERVGTDLPTSVPVHADPRRIDVVLANLIGNALLHGRAPVTVAARVELDTAVVTVTDHGPGIPADVLPHIFERFYKADAARTRSEGSGLGLAIAHENARLHGATLTAGNTPDHGAVFTLTLPLAAAPQEQP